MALKERLAASSPSCWRRSPPCSTWPTPTAATLVVAYTHGQPAQPTTYGHYLGAVIELLLRDVERLRHASRYPDLCSMGAAAITTSGFPLDRAAMAELLGFAEVQENAYGCIAANDYVTSVYGALQLLFVHLGRFVQDLNAWTGLRDRAPARARRLRPGAARSCRRSANPVAVEHLRLLCSLAAGRAGATIETLHNTPFTDVNDAEGEVQVAGYAAFEAGGRALRLLAGFIRAARVDEPRVRRHIDESCITATELADSLVRAEGALLPPGARGRRPPRRGHAGPRRALPDRPLRGLRRGVRGGRRPPARGSRRPTSAGTRRPSTSSPSARCPGGPAPAPLAASLARYRAELDAARAWLDGYRARIDGVDRRLADRARALTDE